MKKDYERAASIVRAKRGHMNFDKLPADERAILVIRSYVATGATLDEAANRLIKMCPDIAREAMDRAGMWPSSYPELRALQKVW